MLSSLRMRASTRSRAWAAAAAALACGCHSFRPVGGLRGSDGEAAMEAVAVRVPAVPLGDEADVTLAIARADRRRVREVRVARRSEPACQGGALARSVRLRGASGQELPTLTLDGEARWMDLVFDRDDLSAILAGDPTVVDVQLVPEVMDGPQSCLRVPLVPSPDGVAWVESPLWDVGAGARVLWLPTPSHGLGWSWLVFGQGGVFLGPVRLGIEAGGGGGEPPEQGSGTSFAMYGGALRLDGLLLTLPAGQAGRLGLEGQLGWDLWFAEGRQEYLGTALTTGLSVTFQGPRAALRLAWLPVAPDWNGFFGRRDASAIGLELYGARWWSSGADPAWVLGLGLSGHMAL